MAQLRSLLAATAVLALCLAGCAGRIASPKPKEPPLAARIEVGEAAFLDQYRLIIPITLSLRNPGSARLRLESVECPVSVQGAASPEKARLVSGEDRGQSIAPVSGELRLDFEARVDVRALDASVSGPEGASRVAFSCAALAHLTDESGGKLESRATAEGSFLIIREPRLRIRTLKIERDILVTTNLRLELEIENPNEFPIDFGPFAYRFYGEGKSWAEGAFDRSLSVPPRSTIEAGLAFEMNFADRDRKLLDLVAELKTVRYALKGKAKVATGLSFLPEFGIAVDEEGRCQVER